MTDSLANVERLLMPNGRLAVSSLPGGKQEEAVRLLLDVVRALYGWQNPVHPMIALVAFARSLGGDPR